jgi:hypothetical protein
LLAFGLIEGGIGVAQYLRPSLGTNITLADTAVTKAIAFHDAAVGAAGLIAGLILSILGAMRSRGRARAEARDARVDERTARVSARPAPDRVIELDPAPSLEQMPVTPEADLAPVAQRVWQHRLAVDLQQQRILKEGIGAESKIDGELYVLSLRNLVRSVKEAQRTTRSLAIWEALTTFGRVTDDPESFVKELEGIDADAGPEIAVVFDTQGTMVRIGPFEVSASMLTAAADQLANTTVGDLSNIRQRAVQNSYSKSTSAPA